MSLTVFEASLLPSVMNARLGIPSLLSVSHCMKCQYNHDSHNDELLT